MFECLLENFNLRSSYLPPQPFHGLHVGMGWPSGAGCTAAIATYVLAKPTTRISILIARFIEFSFSANSLGAGIRLAGIIGPVCGLIRSGYGFLLRLSFFRRHQTRISNGNTRFIPA